MLVMWENPGGLGMKELTARLDVLALKAELDALAEHLAERSSRTDRTK